MSEERSKISLRSGGKRKGRPTISAPRQISEPIPNNGIEVPRGGRSIAEAAPVPRPRLAPQAGGKTSDLVKRRYSTRFNNLPDNFDASAPPIPSMPALTKYESRERRPPPSRGGGVAPTPDIKALRDPRLVADQYVANILSDATEDEIRDYEAALRNLKNRATTDLQQNVYQNRTQFIKISKEAEKLKGEMRALKNLMSELKINTTALRSASSKENADSPSLNGDFSTNLSKRDKRSSVADRTQLWNSQMQVCIRKSLHHCMTDIF